MHLGTTEVAAFLGRKEQQRGELCSSKEENKKAEKQEKEREENKDNTERLFSII